MRISSSRDDHTRGHRWELPVLRYHRIRVNYPYPFLGVILRIILHDFIRKNTIKTVNSLPFFPHYGKLPYFSFKLPHLMFPDNCTKLSLSPKNTLTIYQNGQHSAILGMEVLIETTISDF